MKSNRLLIVAAVFLLLGIVLGLAGFAMADFDPHVLSSGGNLQEKSYFSSSRVTGIEVDIQNTRVKLEPSYDNKVHLTYYENDVLYYTVKESEDGRLTVTMNDQMKWYDYVFNIENVYYEFTIAIPDNYAGDIRLKTSNGDVDISDTKAGNLTLITSNSRITSENLTVAGDMKLDNSNGKISVSDVIVNGGITCETSNSEISLSGSAGESISAKNSNGAIVLNNLTAREELIAETSNSDISMDSVSAGASIVCNTSNGSIEGDIFGKLSDFTVSAKTSNGSSNLPTHMEGGDKKLELKTSCGNISVDFIS